MGFTHWILENLFALIGAIFGISGLYFTTVTLRSDTKTRRVANLLTITANHRELWKIYLNDEKLSRVRDASADVNKHPATDFELVFIGMVIQHSNSVYYAMHDQLVVKLEGLRRDIAEFFSLPVPRQVWDKIKILQNDEFVAFVEACKNWK